jgi:hypothetical protein
MTCEAGVRMLWGPPGCLNFFYAASSDHRVPHPSSPAPAGPDGGATVLRQSFNG